MEFFARWISVKKKKPHLLHVLVAYRFGVMEAKYINGKFYVPHLLSDTEVPDVTHWMRLPLQPTEEG